MAPIELHTSNTVDQSRHSQSEQTNHHRRSRQCSKARQYHPQARLRRGEHQLLSSILLIGGPAAGLSESKGHQQQWEEHKHSAKKRSTGIDICTTGTAQKTPEKRRAFPKGTQLVLDLLD